MNLVHVDGTQDKEAMLELSKLEEPLHFQTHSTEFIVGHDVKDYPNVPPDWYRNTEDQTSKSVLFIKLKNHVRAYSLLKAPYIHFIFANSRSILTISLLQIIF